MKLFIIALLFGLFAKTDCFTQATKLFNESSIQSGYFICRMNNSLIYSYTDDDGEYPLYTLYSLDLKNKNKKLIDSQIAFNCWVKTSDSTLVYSKSGKLFLWNSDKNKKTAYLPSSQFTSIIGLGYNQPHNCLVIFDIDNKSNKLAISLFNKFNNKIVGQKIGFNEIEIEGVIPKIETIKDYFVFSVQSKLYVLDLSDIRPMLKPISDKCSGFALNNGTGVLYYRYDDKNNGYLMYYEGWKTIKADNLPDEKSHCGMPLVLISTINIDEKQFPIYFICKHPYIYSEFKWHALSDVVIYKDEKLTIKLPYSQQKVNDECFEWNWQSN